MCGRYRMICLVPLINRCRRRPSNLIWTPELILYSFDPHPVSSLHIYTFVVSRAFMAVAASQAGDAYSSRAPAFTSRLQGSWCPPWCSIVDATVTVHQFFCTLHFCHTFSLCDVELVHVVQIPARGSTKVLLCLFPGVLWLWHFLYSVGQHPVSSLHIYTFIVSRAFMARVANQAGDLTPSGHLVSPLVCWGVWLSTVVLYCWCHSDNASVLWYFTFIKRKLYAKFQLKMSKHIAEKCWNCINNFILILSFL